ncbi:protein FAM200C-like [Oratosquilla oratoria]|uniref:protein FAM200C-like n=1 Tax=Oratosquilla oratoria TaxID=337810 RepID=UPI003F7597C6
MLGNKSVFATLAKEKVPYVTVTHCVLHRHCIEDTAVNFIRGRAVNHRLFAYFLKKLELATVLLYHTEVKWFSYGRIFARVFELHEDIMQFLRNQGNEITDHFENREFILPLLYLADILTHLNELNVSMQGTGMNIITAREKLSALTKKLSMWIKRIESGNLANSSSLDEGC